MKKYSPQSVSAFLKVLASIYTAYDVEYTPEQARRLNKWMVDGKPFAQAYGLLPVYTKVVRGIVANKDPNSDETLDSQIAELFHELKTLHKEFKVDKTINAKELTLFNKLRLAIFGSESAQRSLYRDIAVLNDPMITQFFTHAEEDMDTGVYQDLKKLVSKYTHESDQFVPTEILEKWQAHNKAKGSKLHVHAEYLRMRREVTTIFKKQLSNLIRGSGKPYMPVREVIEYMNSRKIKHNIPEGFVGMIDDLGKYYTRGGLALMQTPSGEVRMNPTYKDDEDNAYVCEFKPAFAKQFTRAYTVEYRTGSKTKKFNVVNKVLPNIDKLSKKWIRDMQNNSYSQKQVLATLCEFIFQTSARVGNANAQSDGKRTFGATQLLVKHFKFPTDKKMIVTYIGKSAGQQKHIVIANSRRISLMFERIHEYIEDQGGNANEPVFAFRGRTLTSAAVNKYIKSLGFPEGFTVHKLRTLKGTQMVADIIAKCDLEKGSDERTVQKWLEERILEVGKELGHMTNGKITANTAIQNYIDPSVISQFFDDYGVIRPNAKFQKAIDSVK